MTVALLTFAAGFRNILRRASAPAILVSSGQTAAPSNPGMTCAPQACSCLHDFLACDFIRGQAVAPRRASPSACDTVLSLVAKPFPRVVAFLTWRPRRRQMLSSIGGPRGNAWDTTLTTGMSLRAPARSSPFGDLGPCPSRRCTARAARATASKCLATSHPEEGAPGPTSQLRTSARRGQGLRGRARDPTGKAARACLQDSASSFPPEGILLLGLTRQLHFDLPLLLVASA